MGTEIVIETFAKLRQQLHSAACRLLQNEMEADDAVQDAVVNLMTATEATDSRELADYRRVSSTFRWYPDIYWTISKRHGCSASFSFYPGSTSHLVGETFHRTSQIWMTVNKEFAFGGKISLTYGTFFSDSNRKTFDTDQFYYSLRSKGYSTNLSLSFSYTLYKGSPRQAIQRDDTGDSRNFTTH